MSAPKMRYRISNHISSFKNNPNETKLSKKVSELMKENFKHQVTFEVIEQKESYTPTLGKCSLCVAESYQILFGGHPNKLNSRNEIINKCRHKMKFKLSKQSQGLT